MEGEEAVCRGIQGEGRGGEAAEEYAGGREEEEVALHKLGP